ncbi:MAG: hypothetical protein K6G91_13200 [Kiritimatiellae bacterium]|nr:hypothetical protein [Kiritimatiellia bacterium]
MMNIRVCRKTFVVVWALMSFVCIAAEPMSAVSENDLNGFFESIEYKGTNVLLTTHGGGMRFVYAIDGKDERDERVCGYGETITLPLTSVLTIYDRHRFMTISPIAARSAHKGFHVVLEKDHRSIRGGNLTTNFAYMVYLDEKSDSRDEGKGTLGTNAVKRTNAGVSLKAGAPAKMFLKGLKLLPCE